MIRSAIRKYIEESVKKVYGEIALPEFSVAPTENAEHGDYFTNIAMALAGIFKKNPMEVADTIVSAFSFQLSAFSKVEVAKPGFINFWLSENTLFEFLQNILREKIVRSNLTNRDKRLKINIEFISANPTGPLTIGNGRGAFLGDALARVLAAAGHRVVREYYINDARASNQIQELGKAILKKGDSYPGPYTDEIRKRLKKKYFSLVKMNEDDVGFAAAHEIQGDNKKFIEKTLKIKFDVWYSEEKLYKNKLVEKILLEFQKKDAVYTKDNALWFRASTFGDLEDRVAVRTGGAPTYFLPDVAYHADKLIKRKFDRVIDIVGADHHGTFPRVRAGLKALGAEDRRIAAIFTQIVRLTRGGTEVKMSKRRGEYVTLQELVDEVGLDAARYFFLEKSPDTHIDFDLDRAKKKSLDNPVYYIQYAHARIAAIFRKTKNYNFQPATLNLELLKENEELHLIKKLIQFSEVIEDTAHDYHVHRMPRYAFELAQLFHHFYEKHRVITEDEKLTEARLALVQATQVMLQLVLDFMGISAPKKM